MECTWMWILIIYFIIGWLKYLIDRIGLTCVVVSFFVLFFKIEKEQKRLLYMCVLCVAADFLSICHFDLTKVGWQNWFYQSCSKKSRCRQIVTEILLFSDLTGSNRLKTGLTKWQNSFAVLSFCHFVKPSWFNDRP